MASAGGPAAAGLHTAAPRLLCLRRPCQSGPSVTQVGQWLQLACAARPLGQRSTPLFDVLNAHQMSISTSYPVSVDTQNVRFCSEHAQASSHAAGAMSWPSILTEIQANMDSAIQGLQFLPDLGRICSGNHGSCGKRR